MESDILYLESISYSGPQLHMSFSYGTGLKFTSTYWYEFPLSDLDELYGSSFMEKVYFHCAMCELNKVCSLNPSAIDLGKWKRFHTEKFEDFWNKLTFHNFSQWRYENMFSSWKVPHFTSQTSDKKISPCTISTVNASAKCLAFCGGGKDSLVSLKLLESISEPFATFVTSHSIYGPGESQHSIIDHVLDYTASTSRHRVWMYDSIMDSPVLKVVPSLSVKSINIMGELNRCTFSAIPVMLKHGYTQICVGNERSANTGNLVWELTGETINHQSEKTYELELIINSYIKEELVTNFNYFSILQLIHDPMIFQFLTRYTEAVPYTHSCNVRKPWCRRCAKCCYVWLGYAAYLSKETLVSTFGDDNLFDVSENQIHFQELLGLSEHTPFEATGQPDEVRLAFKLCQKKGMRGRAMELFEKHVLADFDASEVVKKYMKVYMSDIHIPQLIADKVLKVLSDVALEGSEAIMAQLND